MPVYSDSDQLYNCLKMLFARIGDDDPEASNTIASALVIMRMRVREPDAEVLIDGRVNPVRVSYGPAKLRPDLDLEITADTLHYLLLGQMNYAKALGSGTLKFRGPVHKSFVMERIFRRGQVVYPEILRSCNQDYQPA